MYRLSSPPTENYKIVGLGNDANMWNSITEIVFPSSTCQQIRPLPVASLSSNISSNLGLALAEENDVWRKISKDQFVQVKFSSSEMIKSISFDNTVAGETPQISGAIRGSKFYPINYQLLSSETGMILVFDKPVLMNQLKIEGISQFNGLKLFGY